MMKFYVSLLLVIVSVKFIDASCLSYGHSCWGAHGKRSFIPQREYKPSQPSDRWALFQMLPEKDDFYQFKKMLRESSKQPSQFPDNEIKALNNPPVELPFGSSEELNTNEDSLFNENLKAISQDDFNLRNPSAGRRIRRNLKNIQPMELDKPHFEK
ncbi:CLUMA_CG005917, isoform A [Clunio marinus]|uniref:CLUMA_CG005917, isoform A n=1 Tax=Clunio marinus TaxID=568069 RepID=A0A1J1HWH9_9DIPT|nr:CLUMA_CG005917, isoform A [Clunio marinus]